MGLIPTHQELHDSDSNKLGGVFKSTVESEGGKNERVFTLKSCVDKAGVDTSVWCTV